MTKIQKNYIQTLQCIAKCGLALPRLILWTSLYNITKIITSRCSHGKSWNSPPSIKRGRGISLQSIYKKGEFKFSHKKGTVGKIRGVGYFKKGGISLFHFNPFQCYLSECLACMFSLFTPFLSEFFVFHGKNLVLLNLINRYMTSANE